MWHNHYFSLLMAMEEDCNTHTDSFIAHNSVAMYVSTYLAKKRKMEEETDMNITA
jgi:hypothetical protein